MSSSNSEARTALAVFASGRGTNFQSIIDAVESGYLRVEIKALITDSDEAFALERAKRHGIESLVVAPRDFGSRDDYFLRLVRELQVRKVDLVVLAGFMRIVGKPLLDAFPNGVINIHPALLPSFPGLHGQRQAADYGVKISGCTVHFVDEGMDTGPIIIQAAVPVWYDDTEESLSERILGLEHKIYPEAIKLFSEGRLEVIGRKVMIRQEGRKERSLISHLSD